mmetsp:Transcript_20340/g.47464  ORF Transcript_20340/g.47464 Transcript_20340/m.47464 type:complete len:663 (+) Transcript_20340:1-1989(+)
MPHPDASPGPLREVYSGGRDGLVLMHDLRLLQTSLICSESTAVHALAVPSEGSEIWTSTSDSNVARHSTAPPLLSPYPVTNASDAAVPPPGSTSHSPMMPTRVPSQQRPPSDSRVVIPGTPRLVDHRVLYNKRNILVRDACSQFALWDVMSGQCVDVPTPYIPTSNGTGPTAEELTKKILEQVNKPVSVPPWFACDLSLGSLQIYLDAGQCFQAETEDSDVIPVGSLLSGTWPGSSRSIDSVSSTPVNLGVRMLRTLFETWVSTRQGGAGLAGGSSWQGTGSRSSHGITMPHVFCAPPAVQDSSGPALQPAPRWDAEQPPGTPSENSARNNNEVHPGTASSALLPAATGLVLVNRHGRSSGYRGRLFAGLFSGVETPELLPPWVVDIVWHQRPPPEELSGPRNLPFCLVRSLSEDLLPPLPSPYCVAPPRTRVKRLMSYLVRALEFDWTAPTTRVVQRRSRAGGSFVTRLGRCCAVPSGRSRSSDQLSADADAVARSKGHNGGSGAGNFGACLGANHGRSYEDLGAAPPNLALRVRVDGSPTPLPSVPAAQAFGAKRKSNSSPGLNGSMSLSSNVEILCNDVVVDPEMSLATVRDFVWRRPNVEMVLLYRRTTSAPRTPGAASSAPLMQASSLDVSGLPQSDLATSDLNEFAAGSAGSKGHD